MTTTYTITLKNCAFFARHGLHDAEEFLGQRFFVDAELEVRPLRPLSDDAIESTVDYGVAFQEIERIVTGQRRWHSDFGGFSHSFWLNEFFRELYAASPDAQVFHVDGDRNPADGPSRDHNAWTELRAWRANIVFPPLTDFGHPFRQINRLPWQV